MKKKNNDFMGKVKEFFSPTKGKIITYGVSSFHCGWLTPTTPLASARGLSLYFIFY
jgi:hypothetical protein